MGYVIEAFLFPIMLRPCCSFTIHAIHAPCCSKLPLSIHNYNAEEISPPTSRSCKYRSETRSTISIVHDAADGCLPISCLLHKSWLLFSRENWLSTFTYGGPCSSYSSNRQWEPSSDGNWMGQPLPWIHCHLFPRVLSPRLCSMSPTWSVLWDSTISPRRV